MITALHVRASARSLVREYGQAAWEQAARRTEALAEAGDWKGVAVWRRIGGAIRAFERHH
jgi:hypothetical protein